MASDVEVQILRKFVHGEGSHVVPPTVSGSTPAKLSDSRSTIVTFLTRPDADPSLRPWRLLQHMAPGLLWKATDYKST